MPPKRQSARRGISRPAPKDVAGTKRKASETTSPESVKSKRPSKEQKTLEESFPVDEENGGAEMDEVVQEDAQADQNGEDAGEIMNGGDPEKDVKISGTEKSALESVRADEKEDGKTTAAKPEENGHTANGNSKGTAVEEDQDREKAQPSNVLEKGIIYFFTRGRVGMDDPGNVTELQRSYFVLRPLPAGAKLTDGAIQDVGNNRLIALPKKIWPKSGKDRFMAFVEKASVGMETLKETFFRGVDYSTKTLGDRHTPEVTPVGEGVYALTSTGDGRASHLAYMLTIPQELGEVQEDIGLAGKGSFVLSSKNPESSSPSYARLPASPAYPKEILEEFGARSWIPTKPSHLDYENASFLLIGEKYEGGSALEATAQDEKDEDKEVPEEELIKLEEEDEERIKKLKGDNSIYEDLGISSKDYPKVKSTW